MANELILVSSRSDVRVNKQEAFDEFGIELEAMSTIGRALEAIEDVALRQRILQWAVERWGVINHFDSDAVEPEFKRATAPLASDPALSVESIGELFGDGPAPVRPPAEAKAEMTAAPVRKAPVESMLQSLAADFQRLADEWNGDATK
jgi:hypothetical protein